MIRFFDSKINVQDVITEIRKLVNKKGENARAIAAVSGGVDSTVASAIVAKAVSKRFIPIRCDNGLMRVGTRQEVEYIFKDLLKIKPIIIKCKKLFLDKLKKVTDQKKDYYRQSVYQTF